VSQYQKSKTNLDLLEQQIVSGSGISWVTCKSVPHPIFDLMPIIKLQMNHYPSSYNVRYFQSQITHSAGILTLAGAEFNISLVDHTS